MNDITQLRGHLFNTLSALQDKENPMDIERAKAVCEVSNAIINSAKVEVDFMRVAGGAGTGFIGQQEASKGIPGTNQISQTQTGMKVVNGNVTTHKLK